MLCYVMLYYNIDIQKKKVDENMLEIVLRNDKDIYVKMNFAIISLKNNL